MQGDGIMQRILFCRVSYMKKYMGACPTDVPENGGQYVIDHGYGHEAWNFLPNENGRCHGFVHPGSYSKDFSQLHIEKISNDISPTAGYADNVLVVFCATKEAKTTVVGWYKNARVWRAMQDNQEGANPQKFNIEAEAKNCCLLPESQRYIADAEDINEWKIPLHKKMSYGFGQSNLWYANEKDNIEVQNFKSNIIRAIENYEKPVHNRIFYVRQGHSYEYELENQCVILSAYDEKGQNKFGYKFIAQMHKGDFILHECKGYVMAISVAMEECPAPRDYGDGDIVYKVRTEYHELAVPYDRRSDKEWFKENHIEHGAFDKNGNAGQRYITYIDNEHASYVLEHAIACQPKEAEVLPYLKEALVFIGNRDMSGLGDGVFEYAEYDANNHPQAIARLPITQKEIPKRNRKVVELALRKANYICEYDSSDKTFVTKAGYNYVEGHHLVPISNYQDFSFSLDVVENVAALCPYCHRLLHYGKFVDKKKILDKLYEKHKNGLEKKKIMLSVDDLYKYYQ